MAKTRTKTIKSQPEQIVFPQQYWVYAADFSLRRPGFCKFHVTNTSENKNEKGIVISDFACNSIDNKKDKLKCHGEILDDILFGMGAFAPHNDDDPSRLDPVFYVREKAINSRGANAEIGIFEVVGISNFWAWQKKKSTWHEIYPVSVKKLITGDARADKSKVANYLKIYVGEQEFKNDDESDAAAVGIAFLLQNGQLENKCERTTEQTTDHTRTEKASA